NFYYSELNVMRVIDRKMLRRLVGARGFEPRTSCAQGRRATRLRYAPTRATSYSSATCAFVGVGDRRLTQVPSGAVCSWVIHFLGAIHSTDQRRCTCRSTCTLPWKHNFAGASCARKVSKAGCHDDETWDFD